MPPKAKPKATKHLHYQVDLEGCPRCGGSHETMVFTPLTNPETEQDLWAFCDVVGEPVLLATEEIDG